MLKKVSIVALGVALAVYALSFTKFGSYSCTAWRSFKKDVSQHVSIDFRIENLKTEVGQLDPEIDRNRGLVAEDVVAVDNLREEIAGVRTKLTAQKDQMRNLVKELRDLKSGNDTVRINGRLFTANEITSKLDRDTNAVESCEKSLQSKERLLEAQERILEANKKKLASMIDKKSRLMEQITLLEAEYKEVQARQTQSRVHFDDSKVADLEKSLEGLRNSVKVAKTKLDMAGEFETVQTEDKPKSRSEVVRKAEQVLDGETKVSTDQK
jgi:chromosome segregation ATPase